MFRFVRAIGGHANDGDELLVAFRYSGPDELREFFRRLGTELVVRQQRPPQPIAGTPYTSDEYARFPSTIPGTRWIEQPGHIQVDGQAAFAWCDASSIRLVVAEGYDVTEANVDGAEAIERLLLDTGLPRIDPPVEHERCVCPQYHPELFE